jgi:hypothetical protein
MPSKPRRRQKVECVVKEIREDGTVVCYSPKESRKILKKIKTKIRERA